MVVVASACESARLLLNSRSNLFPNGLANGSGTVGRFLMDTVGLGMTGYVPSLENLPRYNTDGMSGAHLYMPWWQWEDQGRLGFRGGITSKSGEATTCLRWGHFTAQPDGMVTAGN